MSGQWKPGAVALVQNEWGVWNTAILQVRPDCDKWVYGVSYSEVPLDSPARPLVVIDPEDREAVQRLRGGILDAFRKHDHAFGALDDPRLVGLMTAALREFANPTPPPKCPAGIAIGGTVLRCERAPEHDRISGHRNDSIGQGVRWDA